MKIAVLVSILLVLPLAVHAQQNVACCVVHPYEAGLSVGRNQYLGDIYNPPGSPTYLSKGMNLMTQAFVRRQLTPYVGIRGNFYAGGIAANDIENPTHRWDYRRMKFSSPLLELSAMAEFYPFKSCETDTSGKLKRRFTPYLFAGLGSVYTNPTPTTQPNAVAPPLANLLKDDAAQTKPLALAIPVGVGVKLNVSKQMTVGAELGYRFTSSDYLDGFSKAGNPNQRDGYWVMSIMASYRFGKIDRNRDGVADNCEKPKKISPLPPPQKIKIVPVPGKNVVVAYADTDYDGVIDLEDNCPDEFGDPATCGCPDDDKDGVPNSCDCCPYEKGERAYHGCTKAHQIEYEHVRMTNAMRYCPGCPSDLPGVYRKKPRNRQNQIDAVGLAR